jgi:GH18 family chitinase
MFSGGFFSGFFYSINNQQHKTNNGSMHIKIESNHDAKNNIENKQVRTSNVLVGYVQDFRDPNTLDYSKLTHVIFSFAHPLRDGGLIFNGEKSLSNLRSIVTQAHKHDTKVMLAVGGWFHIQGGESYPYFKEALSKPASRSKLINELVSVINRENLDGIDIDFEHPRSTEDAQNLTIFTKELSSILHSMGKELSIAVNAKIHSVAGTEINNVIYEPEIFKHVDHVNIMAYDGHWDGEYNAANLSPYRYTEQIVHYWGNLFEFHQLAKEKLVLGVPIYAQPEDPKVKQLSYDTIIENNPQNAVKDSVYMNGTTYYYNGIETVKKKTKLAIENGFGGMMLWEAGHDSDGANSLTSTISNTLVESEKFVLNTNKNHK